MTGELSKHACGILLTASMVLAPLGARAQEPVTDLPPVQVEGEAPGGSTRDVYLERNSKSATKTDTPVLETPQSISTITRKQLDVQNPQSVKDALNYTPGVLSTPDTNVRLDSVFLRGFGGFGTSTRIVDFLDGLRLPRGQAFAVPSIDPFLLDRVDVLKGPSAVLYGETSPGGLVNQVSRMPSRVSYNEARVEGGTHARLQGGVTSQGAIDADGQIQYSISGFGRRADTRYDDVDESRISFSPNFKIEPNENTDITLEGFYQYDIEGGYFNSIFPQSLAPSPFDSALDRDLNVGDPNVEFYDREQYFIGLGFEHRFNKVVSVSSKSRYSVIDLDFLGIQMAAPLTATGLLPRQAVRSIEDVYGIATDNRAQFDFSTGIVEHTAIVGVDFQNSVSNWEFRVSPAAPLNVTNPQYGITVGPFFPIINNEQTLRQTGLYAQDQLSLGGLRATLGLRYDWSDQETENRLTGTTTKQSSSSPSYRAGLLYLFDFGLAPYASYSTSFEPTVGVDATGTAFDPTEAEQWEVGIKYEPTFMEALFTVSAFYVRQENVPTPGPTPGFNIQQGEIRSRGIELEARGEVIDNLEVIGALTLLDTEVTESSIAASVGKRPQAVPEYYGSFWANYTFDFGLLDGLAIGAGVRFVGSSFADDANTVETDGFVVADAALNYDLGKLAPGLSGAEATVNLTNMFNEDYYSSCSFNFFCQFGNGRQVLAGLRYKW